MNIKKSLQTTSKQENTILYSTIIFFIISLIPIFLIAKYDYATGDDYGYSAVTKWAWINSGSVYTVIKAALDQVKNYYYGWQGTWLSLFLFAFQPEAFVWHSYWTVPVFTVLVQCIVTLYFGYYFLKKRAGISPKISISITLIVLFLLLQFIDSTKSGIYWYNGVIHYMLPFIIALIAIINGDAFIQHSRFTNLIVLILCQTALGGQSYQAALLAPLTIAIIMGMDFLTISRSQRNKWVRKMLWLLIPFSCELIGLTISALAPGNKVRGRDSFGFSISNIENAFLSATYSTISDIQSYITNKLVIFLFVIIITLLMIKYLPQKGTKEYYKYPLLFILLIFLLNVAMHIPEAFANVSVSGGVPNTNFQVFIISLIATIEYLIGWIKRLNLSAFNFQRHKKLYTILAIMGMVLIAFVGKRSIKISTDYICLNYYLSGQASDYHDQMELQYMLLTQDDEPDVVVPMINNEQGPLMHMPIVDDVTNFTNASAAKFYGKNTIISIPREEWLAIYQN